MASWNTTITKAVTALPLVAGGCFFLTRAALAIDTGLNATAGKAGFATVEVPIASRVGDIIAAFLSLIGVVFLILMIYAGVLWMTSQGNKETVKKAKGIIVGAVIGLIIVFASYAITNFVISNVVSTATEGSPPPASSGVQSSTPTCPDPQNPTCP